MAKILVADDHLANRVYLVTLLGYKGHVLFEARNGVEALERVRTEHPDLVIVDLDMPTMDGEEFVRHLRADPDLAQTRVMFCTASRLQGEVWEVAQRCGVQHVMSKPIEPVALLKSVEEALALSSSHAPPFGSSEFDRKSLQTLTQRLLEQKEALEHEAAERKLVEQEREALYQLAHDLARTSDSRTVGDHLFAHSKRLLNAEYGELFLADADSTTLQGIAAYGIGPADFAQERVDLHEPAVVSLAAHKKDIVVVTDYPRSSLVSERLRTKYHYIQELWSAPLMSGQRLIGVFSVGYRTPQAASAEKLGFLRLLGDEAALVLERIRLTDRLGEREARLRSLFESPIIGIFFVDLASGLILDANEAFLQMLGYQRQDLLAGNLQWEALTPPAYYPLDKQGIEALRRSGTCAPFEKEYLRRDGSRIPVMVGAALLEGTPHTCVVFTLDMAEQKRTEEALQKEQHFISAVLETADALIVVVDASGHIIRFNRACERLSGYEAIQVLGRKVWELPVLPEDIKQLTKNLYERLELDKFPLRLEHDWVTKEGQRRLLAWSNTTLCDAHGRIEYIVGIGIDTTERKKAEETLRLLSSQLLRSQDEERRRIARDLHDSTAQNLSALAMLLSQIETPTNNLAPPERQLLAESRALAEQCLREVRTFSYLLHPPFLDERGLSSALQWYSEGFTRRSNIEVRLEVAADVGRLPGDIELALFRIVQESLTNIHQHSGSPVAHIRLRREGQRVVLTIADEGRGMTAEVMERLKTSGTPIGVGIAGMQERMRQLGGRLEIASGAQGTTLTGTLPGTEAEL